MDGHIERLKHQYPLLEQLCDLLPVTWLNPTHGTFEAGYSHVGLTQEQVSDAAMRLRRFAPLMMACFPETRAAGGIIESPLRPLPTLQGVLNSRYGGKPLQGSLWLKIDSHLPVSGSVKARGGIYEVLVHAERLATEAGMLNEQDDYACLATERFRNFFSQYRIAVGSTGNLGLSIGIMSACLGFDVTVHMSADAREWKKNKLREHGVAVVEYAEDYGVAIDRGRKQAAQDSHCFFIDDENSRNLFLGYAVAGERLRQQCIRENIVVSKERPLFVYLPCGVGGGPGGIAFGLKLAFGDNVHCIFAEPTHSPCMLLGTYTGLHDSISVQDLGIDNQTVADGLAVGRASGFVGRAMARLLSAFYTLGDNEMLALLGLTHRHEQLFLEPSALAGMPGPWRISTDREALAKQGITDSQLQQATHLVWATGGGMVPESERQNYLKAAEAVLKA